MKFSTRAWIIAGIVVLVIAALAAWYFLTPTPIKPFPVNPSDAISSWSFKGTYTGNATLVPQTNADITRLTGLLGKGEYDNYDLYIGIGNDDALLGDGQDAYAAYDKAIAIYSNKGLAFDDLANLFVDLGAFHSAADAFAAATTAEPGMLQYYLDRLTFLTTRLPSDTADIQAALADASKQFGDTTPVLAIEAQWLEHEGRYADAITAWQRAETLSPGTDHSAMDAQIVRDRAKL